MSNFNKFLKIMCGAVGEAYASYNRGVSRSYENIHHLMKDDVEVLIPSDNEMYTFYKKDWNSMIDDNVITLVKKKLKR